MKDPRPEQYFVSPSLASSGLLNEIKNEFSLDEIQFFGDEDYCNDDTDFEFLYQTTSDDYVDFLLSYE